MFDTKEPYASTSCNRSSRSWLTESAWRRVSWVCDSWRKSSKAIWSSSICAKPASIQADDPSGFAAHDRMAWILIQFREHKPPKKSLPSLNFIYQRNVYRKVCLLFSFLHPIHGATTLFYSFLLIYTWKIIIQ